MHVTSTDRAEQGPRNTSGSAREVQQSSPILSVTLGPLPQELRRSPGVPLQRPALTKACRP